MTLLSLHHWDAGQERGARELRRVATGPVVILTCDPAVSGAMWLMADYLPEIAALDRRTFPSPGTIAGWLGGTSIVETVPVPRDTCDWMLMAFWAHPERVLDARARNGVSAFARISPAALARALEALGGDLRDGTWDRSYGHLRSLSTYDAGLRLIVNRVGTRNSAGPILIRDATAGDFPEILALNAESEHFLSPLDEVLLGRLHARSAYHRVVDDEGKVVAFLIAVRDGTDHVSPNYKIGRAHV